MNISEIEEKIDSPHHKKEFRKFANLNYIELYKQLYKDGLVLKDNEYIAYNTLSKPIGDLVIDINNKIQEQYAKKSDQNEIFAFIDSGDRRTLYLVIWQHAKEIPFEKIYKRALRYNKLGAML